MSEPGPRDGGAQGASSPSAQRASSGAGQRASSATGRVTRAWRVLPPERRLAAGAAVGLFVTLFLPWYQETVIVSGRATNLRSVSASLTGWGAFSFVEAAVLLVAAAVLLLLFVRAEGRAFHVPGGDGGVITAAGFWTCVLIVWRMFDKEGTAGHGLYESASGIEWGIFIALAVAALLAYAGSRIKLAHEPEPPLPGERSPRRRSAMRAAGAAAGAAAAGVASRRRGRTSPEERTRPLPEERTRPLPDDRTRPLPEERTRPLPDDRTRPRPHRATGGLNLPELDEIEFDDPPEAPTVRRLPDADDQVTTRLDRPD
ncbi:MAG: hypothetical protein ACR2MK_09880 [Solirubrobacteraceae bacterium]